MENCLLLPEKAWRAHATDYGTTAAEVSAVVLRRLTDAKKKKASVTSGEKRIKELETLLLTGKLKKRDKTCPVGLENSGVICFLNAVVQCLFSIRRFRLGVLSISDEALDAAFEEQEDRFQEGLLFLALLPCPKKTT